MLRTLGATLTVGAFMFGGVALVSGCGDTIDTFGDCSDICDAFEDCTGDIDTSDCIDACEDFADATGEDEGSPVEICADCAEANSCIEGVWQCSEECEGIVP